MSDGGETLRWSDARVVVFGTNPAALEHAVVRLEALGAEPAVRFTLPLAVAALDQQHPDVVMADVGGGPAPHQEAQRFLEFAGDRARQQGPFPIVALGEPAVVKRAAEAGALDPAAPVLPAPAAGGPELEAALAGALTAATSLDSGVPAASPAAASTMGSVAPVRGAPLARRLALAALGVAARAAVALYARSRPVVPEARAPAAQVTTGQATTSEQGTAQTSAAPAPTAAASAPQLPATQAPALQLPATEAAATQAASPDTAPTHAADTPAGEPPAVESVAAAGREGTSAPAPAEASASPAATSAAPGAANGTPVAADKVSQAAPAAAGPTALPVDLLPRTGSR